MRIISYPVSNINLDNTVRDLNDYYSKSVSTEVQVKDECSNKNESINEIYQRLVREGWLEPSDNIEGSTLHHIISTLREKSMAEIVLNPKGVIYSGLPHDYEDSLIFEADGNSGIKMNYSVIHKDMGCSLFKLNCQLLLDKNCQLDEKNSNIFFDFYVQCSEILKQELDKRGPMRKFLDLLVALFNLNKFTSNNVMPSINRDTLSIEYNIKNNTYLANGGGYYHPDFYIEDDGFKEHAEIDENKIYESGRWDGYLDGLIANRAVN
ncbi:MULTISPECIES: hypothetical protein [Yersinia]|uniref:Uncharacterized protein n=3 Tax=Yersinia bercovieri TaxID=634 RepID=A0A2G4U000_YERBE|nr:MULTISPECIES: hypothetical protein [Yersinia]MCB5300803.1 hypothetical protein [Yersinia bercovieri]MDN0102065.1 hypothetical protein [Yersinia bercovieri]PHZ26592.1 hypothetical protein CS533_15650 [Yersinia bercovieri]QDW33481.1 hypothetical protein FFE93_010615 [Yersinia sp. KBS0713]QKJ08175.1 hypothetical protein HRK25_15615 [Yersinia bercovieri ATCC 43970]